MLVASKSPSKARRIPEITDNLWAYFVKVVKYLGIVEMASVATKNGIEIPSENTKSRKAPLSAVALVAASTRIDPSTAPMHGDQTAAKTTPTANARKLPIF